ncbi:AAA family ATPase [soil metagenome]
MGGGAVVSTHGVFVGRERELAELDGALKDAESGHGRLVLVGGEAGIGKSRLADEFAQRARGRGLVVLWGRCWEAGGAPAYWPWIQSVRAYVRGRPAPRVAEEMGAGRGDIARVIPELADLVPDRGRAPIGPVDPEAARFRLFHSIGTFLGNAAGGQPIVMVLEDLHGADEPSLLLLRFLAGQLEGVRLLVLGTFRLESLDREHPLRTTLAELAREPSTLRLSLGGLTEDDVARFIALSTGTTPHPAAVAVVHRETEGNPLFVGEVVRLLAAEARLDSALEAGSLAKAIPASISEAIARRLGRLSERCADVLILAAILGRDFGLDPLERVSGLTRDELLDALDEAVDARLVTDSPGAPGRLRFAHALVRDVLYEELPPIRRMRLHRRMGQVLERVYAEDLESHLAELAHHFGEAAPAGEVGRAVGYARRAGDRAVRLLAFEEAARWYERALGAVELDASIGQDTRCDLLLAAGDAQLKAGELGSAKQTFLAAAEVARMLRSPERLAMAALGYGGRFVWMRPGHDRRMIPLLEEALAGLREADGILRCRLLARLAGALRDRPDREPRASLSLEALRMARRLGDPPTLAYALISRYAANWGPDTAQEQIAIADELVRLAEGIGDRDREVEGHLLRVKSLMAAGDINGARAEMELSARLAEEMRQPSQRWYAAVDRATLALFEGRFEEAERLIPEVRDLGLRAQDMDAEVAYRLQTFALRKEQGRLQEMEDIVRRSAQEYPWYPLFRCVLANMHAELGRGARARVELEALSRDGFTGIPIDNEWLFAVALLPEVVRFLEDAPRAAILYDLLLPHADLNVYSAPELSLGSAARYLGLLSATLGRREEAVRHFEEAIEANERMGSPPWAAHSRHDLAAVLLARDAPGDLERARSLLREVVDVSSRLGMTVLSSRATNMMATMEPGAKVPAPLLRAEREHVFRREGEYWLIAFGGTPFRLKDTKGLRYLARLLAEPGRERHALDLVAAETGSDRTARAGAILQEHSMRSSPGDAGEVLDRQSVVAYRRRLSELEEEVEEARAWADPERAARAEAERDFLIRELSAAVGLGGRMRRASSVSERARLSVTRAIRAALSRIAKQSPALGDHLQATIHTGTFCSYLPDPRVPVDWHIQSPRG